MFYADEFVAGEILMIKLVGYVGNQGWVEHKLVKIIIILNYR